MLVSLLYVDGCPNWSVAAARLDVAFVQAGRHDVEVDHREVSTPEEADALGFRGSPTILVDGHDPFLDRGVPVGLSCRVYRTDAGLAGSPTVDQLTAVLR